MPSETPGFGSRLASAFKRLLIVVVVLGLGATTVFLLSQENARTYTLEVREGKLVVLKGKMMPTGADAWRPEPALVDTYAPIDLKGTQPFGVLNVKFTERDELDRALYSVLEGLAKPRVASDDPKELDDGLYYLRRADRLAGITEEQRLSLKAMKTDVAFYSARMKLEDAQRQIEEAMTQLKIATETPNRHSRAANQMLLLVEPQSKVMVDSLRRAVNTISTGASDPNAPMVPALAAPATAAPAAPAGDTTKTDAVKADAPKAP